MKSPLPFPQSVTPSATWLVAQQDEALQPAPGWPILVIAGLLAVLLIVWGARLFRRPSRSTVPLEEPRAIDVRSLAGEGPPSKGPRLEIYGTPVRVAVIVLASAGRGSRLPADAHLPELMDDVVPGLKRVVMSHRPVVVRWPEQLSAQGFTQSFFGKIALPGDRGKATPWCSVAGRFESRGRQYLIGLVGCASASNGLSQIVIEHEGQWLDVVRIRDQAS